MTSNILRTDSYKFSHFPQYPKNTQHIVSYMESRGGQFQEQVFFGLQYYLQKYFTRPITLADIDYAEKRVNAHMGPKNFNREGWERIVKVHGGFFPLTIKALPEGTVLSPLNALVTVENTDPLLPWTTNYVESILLKVWYPMTVATASREIKKLILSYLEKTGDPAGINFKLHDFGYRGVSSEESAAIGGAAHLVNFMGSDTFLANELLTDYYGADMASFSIPAAEHSTITSWGEEFEYEAFENMIKQYGDGNLYAVVSDSYNIYEACSTLWGEMLKEKVLAANATLVIRPDSGIPHEVVLKCLQILGEKFGYTTNNKGFKVLNKVRVIQGDGIDYDSIGKILSTITDDGWSADNVAFGMGGALLQKWNRDTMKFAFKASAIVRGGRQYDVYKNPVDDAGKVSKKGRLKAIRDGSGRIITVDNSVPGHSLLETVYENGKILRTETLDQIRERAAL